MCRLQTKGVKVSGHKDMEAAALKEWADMEAEQRQLFETEAAGIRCSLCGVFCHDAAIFIHTTDGVTPAAKHLSIVVHLEITNHQRCRPFWRIL